MAGCRCAGLVPYPPLPETGALPRAPLSSSAGRAGFRGSAPDPAPQSPEGLRLPGDAGEARGAGEWPEGRGGVARGAGSQG
ncbi:hypothetical protein DBP20_12850 [Streptomyces sp. CS131]|nr:hypothetical protein DBP20_12850 [Streptomyces sp. CS131]